MAVPGNYARIYETVRRIPPGRVATYGQVAAIAGLGGHARQVGYALSALPDRSDVPWHRVINAQGRISPRSEPAHEPEQRDLLEREGVRFDDRGRISLARYRWRGGRGAGARPGRGLRLVLLLLALAPLALGAQSDRRNAATWYRRAIDREALSAADWELIDRYRKDPAAGPPPGLRDALSRAGPALDLVRRGSREAYSDFDLDYGLGFDLQLPHLPALRQLSRAMQADVLMRLHDGQAAEAAQRAAALYRLAEHMAGDRTLISSLIGRATFDLADGAVQAAIDRGALRGHDAEVVLRGVRPLEGPDPFGMLEAVVVGEQELAVTWFHDRLGAQEDRARAIEQMEWLTDDEDEAARLAAITDEEFRAAVDQYDRMMDDVVEAFGRDDLESGREALERLYAEAGSGEHGIIAETIAPNLVKVHALMGEARVKIDARIGQLEGLAAGTIRAEDELNAALYYAQGIALLRKMDAAHLDGINAYGAGEAELDETIAARLDAAGEIVDLLRQGSERKRCDFGLLRRETEPEVCPAYVAGMHDALRLLDADARRRLAAGDREAAIARLATSHRVVAHLAGDEPIMSAVVAHAAFERAHALVVAEDEAARLTADERKSLLDAAERIRRTDPFGYIASVAAARDAVGRSVADRAAAGESRDPETQRLILGAVGTWDGDRLLYVIAVRHVLARAAADRAAKDGAPKVGAPKEPDPIARLDDLVAADAFAAVRDEAPLVELALLRGDVASLEEREVPRFAAVADRMRRARADLRRGLVQLRPTRPAVPEEAATGPSAR